MDDHLKWQETEAKLIEDCTIFELYESKRESKSGLSGTFYLLKSRDWVNIVPVLTDSRGEERFLMVKQYRQGADKLTIEFPAGLVEKDEHPEKAAGRELLEETGFRAGTLQLIGKIMPNPAFMTNCCYTYLARDLRKVDDQNLDDLEQLEVLEVPVHEVASKIGRGCYLNSMTLIALHWYLRPGGKAP